MESNLAPQWQANKAMLHRTVVGYRSPIRSGKQLAKKQKAGPSGPAFAAPMRDLILQSAQQHQQDDDAQRHSEQPQNDRHGSLLCYGSMGPDDGGAPARLPPL
jgi:hypothetical protein